MSVRQSAEIGMAIALAIVLGALTRLLQLPYGGSINLSGLPIIAMALRHGVRTGTMTGALFGVVDFVLNPYYFHPIQVVLDYPLAFALLGAGAGACRRSCCAKPSWDAVIGFGGIGACRHSTLVCPLGIWHGVFCPFCPGGPARLAILTNI